MAWSNRGHNSPAEIRRILDRDGHQCVHCGDTHGPLEVDHIDNTRGTHYDTDANKQTLCVSCHRRKTKAEEARGRRARRARGLYPREAHPGLIR